MFRTTRPLDVPNVAKTEFKASWKENWTDFVTPWIFIVDSLMKGKRWWSVESSARINQTSRIRIIDKFWLFLSSCEQTRKFLSNEACWRASTNFRAPKRCNEEFHHIGMRSFIMQISALFTMLWASINSYLLCKRKPIAWRAARCCWRDKWKLFMQNYSRRRYFLTNLISQMRENYFPWFNFRIR